MAGEGVTFMQSMIELAKFRSNDAGMFLIDNSHYRLNVNSRNKDEIY